MNMGGSHLGLPPTIRFLSIRNAQLSASFDACEDLNSAVDIITRQCDQAKIIYCEGLFELVGDVEVVIGQSKTGDEPLLNLSVR